MINKKGQFDNEVKLGIYGFIAIVVGIIVLIALFGSWYIVKPGQRAVIVTLGNPDMVAKGEGFHFKWPLTQEAIKMTVQTQKYEAKASAASQDLQTVSTEVTLNYKITPERVPEIYQKIGVNYQDVIIQPAIQEVVKASTAKYTAEQLITKRAEVKDLIDIALRDKLLVYGIIVQDTLITNFDFSATFNAAIENKVVAEQSALAAKNKLEQVKYEADQQVTAAKGQAEAQALLAQSVTTDTLEYQALLNQKLAIDKWNGQLPTFTGGATPFINFQSSTIASAK